MRHNKKFNPLGRTASHRQAMLSNMANSLIEHKRIITTLAKAKALKVYAEPLITTAIKNGRECAQVGFAGTRQGEKCRQTFRYYEGKIKSCIRYVDIFDSFFNSFAILLCR